jgi:hypothetical protein
MIVSPRGSSRARNAGKFPAIDVVGGDPWQPATRRWATIFKLIARQVAIPKGGPWKDRPFFFSFNSS